MSRVSLFMTATGVALAGQLVASAIAFAQSPPSSKPAPADHPQTSASPSEPASHPAGAQPTAPAASATSPSSNPVPSVSSAAPVPPHETIGTPAVIIDGSAAKTLLGEQVRSQRGEDMGRIVDVIVDREGVVRAAVIDFGGFLGVGSREIAVAWQALRFPAGGAMTNLLASLSKDQLQKAPIYKPGEPIVVVGAASPPPAAPVPVAPPPAATPSAAPAPVVPAPAPMASRAPDSTMTPSQPSPPPTASPAESHAASVKAP